MSKKKLFIIDQNFKDYRGHSFNYNHDLYQFYKNKFDVKIYTNKSLDKNINELFQQNLIPYFDSHHEKRTKIITIKIINYLKKKKVFLFLIKAILKLPFVFKIVNLIINLTLNKKNYSNNQLIDVIKLHKNSKILIHTLSSSEFLNLIIDLKSLNKNLNEIFIVYRRDPREIEGYYNLIKNYIEGQNISILTDSHKIKSYFRNKKIKIKQIKIPVKFNLKKNYFLKKTKFKISYLGDARYEKGFFDLPNLLNHLNDKNFSYIIQSNDNGYDLPLLKKTKKKLRKKENVELIDEQLQDKQYSKYLYQSDLVLIPYKKNFYKYRTSGIFYESILSGIPCIVTDETWMSSFYKSKILKKLILKENNNLDKILKYFRLNYKLIYKEINILRKNILIKNNSKNYEILSSATKKKSQTKHSYLSYILSGDMLLREDDGNKFASKNILNILSKFVFKKKFNSININMLCNQNIDLNIKKELFNKTYSKQNYSKINFNFLRIRSNFIIKNNNNLIYEMTNISSKIILNDIIIVNFHYYINIIKDLSILDLKKVIVIVHDVFNKVNSCKEQFIDNENIHYVFLSYYDYKLVNFKLSKKYLIYPFQDRKKIIKSRKKQINKEYYFVSSGSDIDIKNLKKFLQSKFLERNKIKLNLVGSICGKIDKKIYKNLFINCLGYLDADSFDKLYKSQNSYFLILRYFGTGIPIKFLEALGNKSNLLLFGCKKKFGLPEKYLNIFNFNINNLNNIKLKNNFERGIDEIHSYIKDNNYINQKKIKKNLYENF